MSASAKYRNIKTTLDSYVCLIRVNKELLIKLQLVSTSYFELKQINILLVS